MWYNHSTLTLIELYYQGENSQKDFQMLFLLKTMLLGQTVFVATTANVALFLIVNVELVTVSPPMTLNLNVCSCDASNAAIVYKLGLVNAIGYAHLIMLFVIYMYIHKPTNYNNLLM